MTISYEERIQAVWRTIANVLFETHNWYIEYTYDDHVIIRYDDKHYRTNYTIDALGNVVIAEPATWQRVERAWLVAAAKSIRSNSRAVKKVGEYTLRGYGVVFNGKDLVGDTFTKDTDFGQDRSFVGLPVFYDHALSGVKSQIGTVKAYEFADDGLIFEIEIDKRKKYADTVMALAESGALGQSTGAVAHLVHNEQGEMKRWIIGEVSLTPTPAEPRTSAIPVKTTPKAAPKASGDDATDEAGDDTYIILED